LVGGAADEAASKTLALALRSRIAGMTGMPRSTYIGKGTALSIRSDIAGLNLSTVPGVMLEAGNMRNSRDAKLLTSSTFRAKLAVALSEGVAAVLNG
jgi:N-acetylmuramoyl-L-alanine amidase